MTARLLLDAINGFKQPYLGTVVDDFYEYLLENDKEVIELIMQCVVTLSRTLGYCEVSVRPSIVVHQFTFSLTFSKKNIMVLYMKLREAGEAGLAFPLRDDVVAGARKGGAEVGRYLGHRGWRWQATSAGLEENAQQERSKGSLRIGVKAKCGEGLMKQKMSMKNQKRATSLGSRPRT